MTTELAIHPAADAFPMMDDRRFSELVEDIRTHGLRVSLTLCDGKILDGRNRYAALKAIDRLDLLRTEPYDGDPWAYVWSLNGSRRDLIAEQRYLIWKHCTEESDAWQAAKLVAKIKADEKRSEAAKGQPYAPKGGKRKAESEKVVRQSVEQPTRRDKGNQAKASASKTNPGAVARGDKLAADRPDLAESVRLGKMKPAEAHRQMKRDAVAAKVAELPKGKFRVWYADPPWAYNDKQAVKGEFGTGTGAAEGHYPSMSTSELCAMDIAARCTDDAVLFLWVTCPLLPDGLQLMAAWGFKYKTHFVWDKIKHNMGHYSSVRHELLLLGTRGSCTPDNVKLFDSVQSIERGKHSAKPEQFREIIDTLYPHGSRMELFARTAADGWERWGNES
jgi:N6-adenosine-specific RNA methylase IME4